MFEDETMFLERLTWGKSQFLLEKGMNVAVKRHRVLADNIANIDVPHFKRSDVSYEAQLRRAFETEKKFKRDHISIKLTHSKHMAFSKPLNYKKVNSRTNLDYLTTMRNDGNNVDVEHEMSLSVKNQLRYQAMANLMNSSFRNMKIALQPT